MDKLAQYQSIVQGLLLEYAKIKPAYGEFDVEVSFDTERHHYNVWHMGWLNKRWVHHCPIHFAIRNDKIWLLANSTERELDEDLIARGVPKQDIVMGFYPSYVRELTGYGIG